MSAATLLLLAHRGAPMAANTAVATIDTAPVIGTALDYTPGVWTGATSVSAQAQRSLDGLTGWTDVGDAWDSILGTPYTPVDGDFGYFMRPKETATPGDVEATGTANETPTIWAGLQLWLDATDADTLFQASDGTTPATADGDVIGYWGDKSGNSNHAIQGTTANKPLLKLAIQNGLDVIRFDGSNDAIVSALSLPNTVSALIVYANKAGDNRTIFSTNAAANSPLQRPDGTPGIRVWPHQSPAWLLVTGTSYLAAGVMWHRWNYTGDAYSSGLNTAGASDTVARDNPGGSVQLGASGATPSEPFSGDICEALVFNRVITDDELTAARDYLNAKWAVY